MTVTEYGAMSKEGGVPRTLIATVFASILMAGCVTVEAPDKPIVINLNIKIEQEVVLRLDGDAKNLIEEQGDIF